MIKIFKGNMIDKIKKSAETIRQVLAEKEKAAIERGRAAAAGIEARTKALTDTGTAYVTKLDMRNQGQEQFSKIQYVFDSYYSPSKEAEKMAAWGACLSAFGAGDNPGAVENVLSGAARWLASKQLGEKILAATRKHLVDDFEKDLREFTEQNKAALKELELI